MLRPRPARWFEILAARDDATLVLEALARTGAVELEARASATLPQAWADVAPLVAQHLELQARYHAYWPPPQDCPPSAFPEPPLLSLQRALAVVRAWAQAAEPVIQALQQAQAERAELSLWQRALAVLPMDSAPLAQAGPQIGVRLFVLPAGTDAAALWPSGSAGLATSLDLDGGHHLLVAAAADALQSLAQSVTTLGGSVHRVPPWWSGDRAADTTAVAARLLALDQAISHHRATLAALQERLELAQALGDAHRLHWVLQNVQGLEAGEWLCWVTGWSSDAHGASLAQALHRSGARALLHFAPPPAGLQAPLLLDNPAWARPFEIFSRALGMPAATEADPSPVLAVAVPLMFGYMFGDVGQGIVIAALGAWARRRFPIARLLMVGGVSAALFGFVFGGVFSVHHLLPALWLHPLDEPLPVLLAPVVGGAVLLTLGLGLDALAAFWRGEGWRWLLTDAARVVVYLALLAAFVAPLGLPVAALAALWFCVGHAVVARRAGAALAAVGELLEKTLQILINTLSFARVGAFALAHAGLSSAVVALADAATSLPAKVLVFVLGNLLVIAIEALVVAIQTTRLVLFEFFTRFLQGSGRVFRPLPLPPFAVRCPCPIEIQETSS